MIKIVENKKQLMKFIKFIKELYKENKYFVYPFFNSLKKELKKEVLKDKTYRALLYIEDKKVRGRILYTFKYDKKNKQKKCYFSFFDFYNDFKIAESLVDFMKEDAQKNDVHIYEGPYCPYDPDTRRGVLTNCFEKMPSVFLTYNYEYYLDIYEQLGFTKLIDTYSMHVDINDYVFKKASKIGRMAKTDDIIVSTLNRQNLKEDIMAVSKIMASATSEINYEEAPSYEMIESIFNNMKMFIKDEFVIISREKATNKPIGFLIILPELNQIFCHFKGYFNLFKFLYYRNKINKVRGWLQYIIPEYQNTMLLGLMFSYAGKQMEKDHIKEFEGGTIVEENIKSYKAFEHFGGYLDKIYRIYQMEDKKNDC